MKNLKKLSRENLKNLKGGGDKPIKLCDDHSDTSNCYSSQEDCMYYSGVTCEGRRSCDRILYCM
ncbi:bacteriocin-like protein [Chryseobacterium sp. 5_R23647]|uniref:bacteriocin-like protein n=1 Tax=Chryseobacterium sp. 5_R23647 TaxID=2258964 RepID=UPI00269B01F7